MTELEKLKDQNKRLRGEVRRLKEAAARRNRQLSALHLVWCSGPCKPQNPISEELVIAAEKEVLRLREKWTNIQLKHHWSTWTEEQKAQWWKDHGIPKY